MSSDFKAFDVVIVGSGQGGNPLALAMLTKAGKLTQATRDFRQLEMTLRLA